MKSTSIETTYIHGIGAVVEVLVPVDADVVSSRDSIPVFFVLGRKVCLFFGLGNKDSVESCGDEEAGDCNDQTRH